MTIKEQRHAQLKATSKTGLHNILARYYGAKPSVFRGASREGIISSILRIEFTRGVTIHTVDGKSWKVGA